MRYGVAVAVVVLAAGCGGSQRAILRGEVTVDGRQLAVHCSGNGSPTVVLEAGSGFGSATWVGIRPRVARLTRVCAYDRLGEGGSDKPPAVQTVDDQARTLRGLVDAAGWDGPFVFAGHSWGGAVIQRFAAQHPNDVVGIVLVDSSQADAARRWLKMLPRKPKSGLDPYAQIRELLAQTFNPRQNPEAVDWGASENELRRLRTLDGIPLVVLTAGVLGLSDALPTESSKQRAYAIWLDGHKRLAQLSSNSVHAVAQFSSHFIHEGQPDVVTAAIRAVVRAARDDEHLPQCRALFRGVAGVECR